MRATSVLSEGYLQRPDKRRKNANLFVHWSDEDVDEQPPARRYAKATEVTVCEQDASPVEVSVVRKQLPNSRRTQVDFVDDDEQTWSMWWDGVRESLGQAFGSTSRFRLMYDLTVTDAMSRKGSYVLSFCSVCSVVCVCVIMITILSSFAIVSLRMAEDSYGAVDLQMRTGGFAAQASSLNYTHVTQVLSALPAAAQQHSYRVDLEGRVRKQASCTLQGGSVTSLWLQPGQSVSAGVANRREAGEGRQYTIDTSPANATRTLATTTTTKFQVLCQETCISDYCNENVETVSLVVLDPTTDPAFTANAATRRVGAVLQTLPYGHVVLSESLVKALEVTIGDPVLITATMDPVLRHVLHQVADYEAANPHLLLSVRVGAVMEDSYYPTSHDDFYILFPPQHFTSLMVDAMAPSVTPEARAAARLASPAEYASVIVFQMPEHLRKDVYVKRSFTEIRLSVAAWGAPITEKLGANQVTMETPLLTMLYRLQFFSSFVGLIISIIVLALALVSTILIYTLLSIGIETKSYELGIHRMVGFTRAHLVMLVFTNTYFFTLPAWAFGLVMGQVGYWAVRACIVYYAAVPLGMGVSASSVGWATLAGLGVPFIAALLPIRSLISMDLPDALNTSRGRSTGVVYRIERGESRETDLLIFGLGFLAALAGFCMYSFFPTSLITMNFALMFYILFMVLMGMLGGLVLLASNFERVMETVVMYVFLFFEAPAVRSMVEKSLAAHRQRNQQTTIMYALSVGFVVFITVAFNCEISTLKLDNARSRGADLTLYFRRAARPVLGSTPAFAQTPTTLPNGTSYVYEESLLHAENMMGMTSEHNGFYFKDYIELEHDLMEQFGEAVIPGMVYRITSPVGGNLYPVQRIRVKTFGQRAIYDMSLGGVPPNFYNVVDPQFVKVNKYDTDVGRYGLSEALYAESPARSAIIATTANRVFALRNFSDQFLFETRTRALRRGVGNSDAPLTAPRSQVHLSAGQAIAVMDSSAVFLMTKFPNSMGEVLLSLPTTVRHADVPYMSCNVLSLAAAFLRVSSPAMYEDIETYLRHWLSERKFSYTIRDLTGTTKDIKTVDTIFNIFFIVTLIVIMLICFFSLMSSMTANVLDSAKEIGVLLCLGMSHYQVYRVYVWEAFVLVLSSGLLGLIVGMASAQTLLLQSSLFTQLTIPFPFPFLELTIIVVMGFGSALAASVSPVTYLLNLPSITHILRRVI